MIIEDLSVVNIERGSVPVATVLALVLDPDSSSAQLEAIVSGMEEAAGGSGRAVELDGVSALFIPADPKAFIYAGSS